LIYIVDGYNAEYKNIVIAIKNKNVTVGLHSKDKGPIYSDFSTECKNDNQFQQIIGLFIIFIPSINKILIGLLIPAFYLCAKTHD
jgi:hypothetical protein